MGIEPKPFQFNQYETVFLQSTFVLPDTIKTLIEIWQNLQLIYLNV